ncbi:MAG: thiamine diphosphokinase [Chloroflexota bacterium]
MRAILIANGELNHLPVDLRVDDYLIAVDGGASHYLRIGLNPDVVLGDFDSLPERDRIHLINNEVEVIAFPARKDEIDLELGLFHALERGASEVHIYAALGGRWDMTIANMCLLSHPKFSALEMHIIDGPQEIRILRGGEQMILEGEIGDTVSLIPLQEDAHGITTNGLEYPLKGGTLRLGATKGISNQLNFLRGAVSLEKGALLVVVIHQPEHFDHKNEVEP